LQWFMKLPIEVRALSRFDCRPNLLLRKHLSFATYCKFEKIPEMTSILFSTSTTIVGLFKVHHLCNYDLKSRF
jgi:hypothetical protein